MTKRTAKGKLRPTLFDSMVDTTAKANMFCRRADLTNEASVETFFVNRVVANLGYKDSEIKTKESLEALPIPKGRKQEKYKPDFVLFGKNDPRIVVDAKAPNEDVDDYILQCSGYCAGINRKFTGEKPVRYYVITNGLVTKVFPWDEEKPIRTLYFQDFQADSAKWQEVSQLLGAKDARRGWKNAPVPLPPTLSVTLAKPGMDEVKNLFARCHRLIWKAEKRSPSSAFFEFVKLMFVKMHEDRRLHADPKLKPLLEAGAPIPASEVKFSTRWIESLESAHQNPVDALLFQSLMHNLEDAVAKGDKKRIFPFGVKIELTPGTIKEVVSNLEGTDLWGIDEDLNGRLFETFLSATMRGQALGQYFTPRTIVKFITRLGEPVAKPGNVEVTLDACCGTGGFLIELLTEMRNQVRTNKSLTEQQKSKLLRQVADESIFGMDAGKDPPIAQIARINMYLHGDGGSRIYAVDALDKEVLPDSSTSPEEKRNCEELQQLLVEDGLLFDLILTNPPFSMDYSEKLPSEARILQKYELGKEGHVGTAKRRKSLRSSIMFLERYHDLLKPGGRLVTVMDDSILSGSNHEFARAWLRRTFLVKAIISLPGDAFQRSGARTKTSILYLVKKADISEEQAAVFMAECSAVGLDDLPQRTPASVLQAAKEKAKAEVESVCADFKTFQDGGSGPWLVGPERIGDRLDVKYCMPRVSAAPALWKSKGIQSAALATLADPAGDESDPKKTPDDRFTFFEVGYDGIPRKGDTRLGRETTYATVRRAMAGDLIVSHINAVHGAMGVLPVGMENLVISPEYTILRLKDPKRIDPMYLWAVLRSPEVRAELISSASGGGRHRVDWDTLKAVQVPLPDPKDGGRKVGDALRQAHIDRLKADEVATKTVANLEALLGLSNEAALKRIQSAKPPR